MNAEIFGGEAAKRNLKCKIVKIDQDSLKQRAMLYATEFNVQQVERKIRRLQGDRTEDEKIALLGQIDSLNLDFEEHSARFNTLTNQNKRSQESLRQTTRKMNDLRKDKQDLMLILDDLGLYGDSAVYCH